MTDETPSPLAQQDVSGDECPVCGATDHPPGPIGGAGSWCEGIEIKLCPNIPEGHIWANGKLVRIGEDRAVVLPVVCPHCGEAMAPKDAGEFWVCGPCGEILRYDDLAVASDG